MRAIKHDFKAARTTTQVVNSDGPLRILNIYSIPLDKSNIMHDTVGIIFLISDTIILYNFFKRKNETFIAMYSGIKDEYFGTFFLKKSDAVTYQKANRYETSATQL